MSMDLNGINNQNEYYTNHYFASMFEENAQDTLKRWREQASASGEKTPWQKLNLVSKLYFTIRDKSARFRNNEQVKPFVNDFLQELLPALGYPYTDSSEKQIMIDEGFTLPVSLEMTKSNGAPLMWIVPVNDNDPDLDILASKPFCDCAEDNESLASRILFDLDESPRWVLYVGLWEMALIDRNKWNEKRYLQFELEDIFSRKEETTLQAMAVLLHCESICPQDGSSLLDQLDDNSHKHASEVSVDLKYALRECIELLGNEVIRDMRERQHVGVFGKELAEDLTLQCLRYMYRILFMLFIEAKPELGYAPMKAMAYASGYSFDSLRDIAESARGDSDLELDGTFLKDSLDMLFKLVYNGYPEKRTQEDINSEQGVFRIEPLKAHIFDPERTALIERAKLRNSVVVKIIDLMSMTRGKKGKRCGRISYSNLGINQLGSVYEALLSYRGFFAEEDLYEVKRKGDKVDDLDVGYFITESELPQYDEDERIRVDENDPTSPLRVHEKGKFIYRLAGREREKSASYYTPEVLTKCLVKYALKELLEGKAADEILQLTVCEPAMGSAAFLNEATTQLAEAYLSAKEKELGKTVPHDERVQHLQKIKMFIADRNVYGIDLNPVAVELAEVSLWLNSIYAGGYVPWFRTQINNGNSLIGARRQCYNVKQLSAEKGGIVWYNNAPERVEPGQKRKFGTQVYHFLLGDPGMCNYTDKVIKSLEPDKINTLKKKVAGLCRPLTADELDYVLELSATIDNLWDAHIDSRREIKEKTTDPLTVWGQPEDVDHQPMTIREKDKIYDELYRSIGAENASPYARLKAVMDYWCALWFWPIDKADDFPTRQEFLFQVQMMLGMDVVRVRGDKKNAGQLSIFDLDEMLDGFVQDMIGKYDRFGAVNLDQLRNDFGQLRIANEIANMQHFFHWELEFADVFQERGGFDLIVGNPPWIKISWNEGNVLGDKEPLLAIKKYTAAQTTQMREELLDNQTIRNIYFAEYEGTTGQQSFFNAVSNYPDLKGQQTNLYMCFLPQAWGFGNESGFAAFVHPEGVYDDPKGGALRRRIYTKLRKHFMFANELKLFAEVDHHTTFSLNVYGGPLMVSFDTISNLYEVGTIEECYEGDPNLPVPGIKDEEGWCTKGHPDRIIKVGQKQLKLFAKLFDGSNEWRSARLPVLHAKQLIDVLEIFDAQPITLESLGNQVFTTLMWDETNAVKKDKTIAEDKPDNIRYAHFPEEINRLVYSGPHISIGNPLNKTSRRECTINSDYDSIDLRAIGDRYLQRCNYHPACDPLEFNRRVPVTPWGTKCYDDYRYMCRKMLNQSGERTLIGAIVPPLTTHTNGLLSVCFPKPIQSVIFCGLAASVPYDFFIKAMGKSNITDDTVKKLPYIDSKTTNGIIARILLLNCVSDYYSSLWNICYDQLFSKETWAKKDHRLDNTRFSQLSSSWCKEYSLCSEYERRQALIEIDVLTALNLKMTLKQLKTIYEIQFPVLQQYEIDTWYDQTGRIVFTNNRGIVGAGFDRPTFEKPDMIIPVERSTTRWNGIMKDAPAGYVFERTITDDTQPGGPVERTIRYVAPFDRCDREKDYETAWEFFSKLK